VTSISASPAAETATRPPSVLLQVTGAPNPPANAYASNFGAGVDSWTTSGTGNTVAQDTTTTPKSLKLTANPGPGTASRVVTGLTVGASYRLKLLFITTQGQMRLGVSGIGATSWVSGGAFGFGSTPAKYVALDYVFTATATSHTITVEAQRTTLATASVNFHTVTVQPAGTWQGTTIYRTDNNGTDVPVREDVGGQDVTGGTMTVTDWEAALIGEVNYRVVDGLGGTASTFVDASANTGSGVWITLPASATPSAGAGGAPACVNVPLVTGYDAAAETTGVVHQVIGRADKIGNPGPLSTRSGSLELFELDYAAAKAVRALLANGDVALLRQPDYVGLDLYFLTMRVAEQARQEETAPRRWQVSVGYEEVVSP